MSIKHNIEQWVAQLDYDDSCDISDRQVSELIRGYSALEAKCAALAAENGQMLRLLTDISENHDEYVNQDEYLYAGVPMDYVSEINAYVSRDVEAENPFKETDTYLAEVREQGVEMVIAYHHERSDALAEVDRNGSFRHHSAAIDATDVLMKIRQEAAQ